MVPIPEGWDWPPGGWGYTSSQGRRKRPPTRPQGRRAAIQAWPRIRPHAFAARWLKAGKGMKGLQLAGGWKKFAIPAEIYGHLEITGVHSQMRELSGGVKNPVKS